jgi:hypothetical protein
LCSVGDIINGIRRPVWAFIERDDGDLKTLAEAESQVECCESCSAMKMAQQ